VTGVSKFVCDDYAGMPSTRIDDLSAK